MPSDVAPHHWISTRRLLTAAGWAVAVGVTLFWRLGYPTFWDPDEAHYAESTREMLAAGDWLSPSFNGQPFFDKPFLFHALQMISFAIVGPSELAARLVPALSAVGLLLVVYWIGRELFDAAVGRVAALMFLTLPATFALTRYAILDMTFTLFLIGSAGCVTVAALRERPVLQWPGYVLLGLAILTKGPLALALTGLTFVVTVVAVPSVRRRFLGLHWIAGLGIAGAVAAPWFIYMWMRFGGDFTHGYALRENIWLYARPLYGNQPSYFFYTKTLAIALLPWTWLLLGRLVDAAVRHPLDERERVLLVWAGVVLAFFSFSRFKLDHYIFPAAPALCLVAARGWSTMTERVGAGVEWGLRLVSLTLIVGGMAGLLLLDRVPVALPSTIYALPVLLIAGGLAMIVEQVRRRDHAPNAVSLLPFATLVLCYAVVIGVALPAFERTKPVARLARKVLLAADSGAVIGAYHMDRWSSSWRYYVGHPTVKLETPDDLRAFFAMPGTQYCAMSRREFEALRRTGVSVHVTAEEEGLFTTTGRNLRRGRNARRERFVVVTDGDFGTPAAVPPVI